ncbi:LysR family transcriptional regulator [Pseudomonas borbori]|uniref:DNA-binding transcriptional regulator, LysR family n=1 Tax=Pseudomonas borbori TaxID=289003 RepID=A0A1I5WDG6_9PSED|nr:LysR family transcriptional regulator [Pseudomonas borbori]SFQ17760.1 DNA-binding transcriptional regulator, LysR family [Pseudomonas borbori]
MELRHLRCFIAVAEELHFARAAARLHIEQSPLSRIIKELEYRLGVQLFERTTRRTHLTWAGKVLLEEARRVFAVVDQAKASVKSAAAGYRGRIRVALSDGIPQARLAALLAQCREEEPEVEICLSEVTFTEQVRGLNDDLFDIGFAQSDEVGAGLLAEPVWFDPLVVAVPARHPLLTYRCIPLEEVVRYPLVLCDPQVCEGFWQQLQRVLSTVEARLTIADRVPTLDLLMALVAAGYGLGFSSLARITELNNPDVVARQFAGSPAMLTTYLIQREAEPSEQLRRFIDRISPAEDQALLPNQTQREDIA